MRNLPNKPQKLHETSMEKEVDRLIYEEQPKAIQSASSVLGIGISINPACR